MLQQTNEFLFGVDIIMPRPMRMRRLPVESGRFVVFLFLDFVVTLLELAVFIIV